MRLWLVLVAVLSVASPGWAQEVEDPAAEPVEDPAGEPEEDPGTEPGEEAVSNKPDFAQVVADTRAVWQEPEGSTASEEEITDSIDYMMGFAVRIMYHEFGHGLVSEFNIPVLGREEDAVDSFAVINMIADDEDPALDALIERVIDVFYDFGETRDSEWAQHSFDSQRAAMVVCLLVGHDPESYMDMALESGMPKDRAEGCKWDYKKAEESWEALLGDKELEEGEAPPFEINIVWGDATPELEEAKGLLEASGIAEAIAYQIETTFRLTGSLAISFETCNERNAYFVPAERKVKFCYEYGEYLRSASIAARTAVHTPPDGADDDTDDGADPQ
jgi:hypothetical protein